jgi:hypothetical protein
LPNPLIELIALNISLSISYSLSEFL